MLKSKRDRVEYARYILTGEIFLQGARKTTGNPTFFTPSDQPFYQRCEENIFHSVDINKLDYKDSLLTSTEKRFQDNLLKLKKNIKEGQIRVTVSTASISPSNKAILDEIKRLEPATIDWSNLPDYLTTKDFFSTARLCSVEGTNHSFHLMNWGSKVFGTNLVDYVPYGEDYGTRNFSLNGRFRDKHGVLRKLVRSLEDDLVSGLQSTLSFLHKWRTPANTMGVMDLSEAVFKPRFCEQYVNFMFEDVPVKRRESTKAELSVFERATCNINVCFQF